MRSISQHLLAISTTALVSVAIVFSVRCCANPTTLAANNEVAGNYLQTTGTIYAVLLAFVVFVVWSQHNDTRRSVETEANEVRDLCRILVSLSPALDEASTALAEYVQAAICEEWPMMAKGGSSARAAHLLRVVWGHIEQFNPRSPREEILLAEAMTRFDDLSDARSSRLTMIRQRLPTSMWTLLLVGGLVTIASMGFFGVPSAPAHALMTCALGGLIAFVLSVIADLDNPFAGDWRVTPVAFEDVQKDWG